MKKVIFLLILTFLIQYSLKAQLIASDGFISSSGTDIINSGGGIG